MNITGPRRAAARQDAWAAGPRTYLGAAGAGLPQPVHHHRPRQPVGAVQHAGRDRAACGVDRRLHRPYARSTGSRASRRTPEATEDWVDAGQRGGQRTLLPRPTTPGTWAPTCRASRGSSCPTPAAWRAIARSAPASRAGATRASRSALKRRRCELTPSRANARCDTQAERRSRPRSWGWPPGMHAAPPKKPGSARGGELVLRLRLEVAGVVALVQLARGLAGDAVDHAPALHRRPLAGACRPSAGRSCTPARSGTRPPRMSQPFTSPPYQGKIAMSAIV